MVLNHKLVFAASLVLGIAATYFLVEVMERRSVGAITRVVTVSASLPKGTTLQPEHLALADWPSRSAPTGAYHVLDDLQGRMLRDSLVSGEPILPGKLWPAGSKGNLLDAIEVGQRAMTIPIRELNGIDPEDLVGAPVDVLMSSRDDQNQAFSKVVLESVQVLAVPGAHSTAGRGRPQSITTVTLQLSPQDAQRLDLARNIGSLSLSLRHHGDTHESHLPGVPRMQLIHPDATLTAPAPEQPATHEGRSAPRHASPSHTIEVIRGAQLMNKP